MNRNRKEARRKQVLPVWTYPQAQNAVPYIRSIMRSLREHRLEQLGSEMRAKRLAARPGRPDRTPRHSRTELRVRWQDRDRLQLLQEPAAAVQSEGRDRRGELVEQVGEAIVP